MSGVLEIHTLGDLLRLMEVNPDALVVTYFHKAETKYGYDDFETIAQQASSFRPQQVIFTRHNLDDSIDIQQYYHIGVIPSVVMLRNADVVQRLEDPSEKMLWKYVRKHTSE